MVKTAMKWLRVGALAAPAMRRVIQYKDTPERIPVWVVKDYTGFDMDDGSWSLQAAAQGWLPFIGVTALTVGVQKLTGILRRF